jgi:hypothetical protein
MEHSFIFLKMVHCQEKKTQDGFDNKPFNFSNQFIVLEK